MRVARPPSGFRIVLGDAARTTLEHATAGSPRLPDVWASICERLKFTAHREGTLLPNNRQLIKFPGDAAFGVPTVAITYVVVGDQVRVERMLVQL